MLFRPTRAKWGDVRQYARMDIHYASRIPYVSTTLDQGDVLPPNVATTLAVTLQGEVLLHGLM